MPGSPRTNDIKVSRSRVRHEIATGAVGFLIALAFAAMVDSVRDSVKLNLFEPQSRHLPIHLSAIYETTILAFTFFFTGLSFFLGTQTYLWSSTVQEQASKGWWLADLMSTIFTLTVLVFLGATTAAETESGFIFTLISLYVYVSLWAWAHKLIKRTKFIGKWHFVNPVVAVLTFSAYECIPSKIAALLIILVIQFATFLWDVWMVWNTWEP